MPVRNKDVDLLAELEVEALLEGLQNPDLRKNPAFLEKVRKFLKENHLRTTPETPGIKQIQNNITDLPTFSDDEGGRMN